jgi:hypothetical protein
LALKALPIRLSGLYLLYPDIFSLNPLDVEKDTKAAQKNQPPITQPVDLQY